MGRWTRAVHGGAPAARKKKLATRRRAGERCRDGDNHGDILFFRTNHRTPGGVTRRNRVPGGENRRLGSDATPHESALLGCVVDPDERRALHRSARRCGNRPFHPSGGKLPSLKLRREPDRTHDAGAGEFVSPCEMVRRVQHEPCDAGEYHRGQLRSIRVHAVRASCHSRLSANGDRCSGTCVSIVSLSSASRRLSSHPRRSNAGSTCRGSRRGGRCCASRRRNEASPSPRATQVPQNVRSTRSAGRGGCSNSPQPG